MSKKGGDAAPAAPNPQAVANAQTASNVNTAVANTIMSNANENGPTGSVRYNQIGTTHIGGSGGNNTLAGGAGGDTLGGYNRDGTPAAGGSGSAGYDIPQWERTVTLSPEQQRLYNQQTQLGAGLNDLAIGQVGRLTDVLGRPVDTSGISPIKSSYTTQMAPTSIGPTDFSADRQAVTDATMARYRPQLDIDQNSLDTRLANQGIEIGSTAYGEAQAGAGRNRNDAYSQAVLAGATEQDRLFNQTMQKGMYGLNAVNQNNNTNASAAGFNNQAAGQQLQQTLALRNQPINEISSLMSGGQVSMPNFQPYQAGNVAGTPVGQYAYNSANIDQSNYQAQAQRNTATTNAAIGGLFGLGAAAMTGGASAGLFGLGAGRTLLGNSGGPTAFS